MKKVLRILGVLVVLAIVGLLAFIYVPVQTTPPKEILAADGKIEPGRGEYVMRAGDCMACHTATGGSPLAGGRGIESPMGTIWSSNITPDKETGIGNWTLDQFRSAMVDGVVNGKHLYPAMPYENYRFMSESDIQALYTYLMNDVKPVKNEVQATELAFPFNLRFGIRAWNWLALSGDSSFKPMEGGNEQQLRGQYLVEGAGHCAACHSPRTAFMAQDGTRLGDANFLTGGELDGWSVPALRGPNSGIEKWSTAELAAYLGTGRNVHAIANGEMALAVEHSLQYLNDQDLNAMAVFLKSADGQAVQEAPKQVAAPGPRPMPAAPADEAGQATAKMLTAASPDMPLGARLYLDNCAACHFVTGKGAPEIFPELQGNAMVQGKDPGPLLSVILNGTSVPSTDRRPMHLVMQGYSDRLNDEEVAALASFVRSGWGNKGGEVSADQVAKVRSVAVQH